MFLVDRRNKGRGLRASRTWYQSSPIPFVPPEPSLNNYNNNEVPVEASATGIRFMSWNTNSWRKIGERTAMRNLLQGVAHVIALQETREEPSMPKYGSFFTKASKINAALLVLEQLQPEPVACSENFVAIRIKMANNKSVVAMSLYIHTPVDDATRQAKILCRQVCELARARGEAVLLGGDFNSSKNSTLVKELAWLLPYIIEPQHNPKLRAGGKAKVIDFVMGSMKMETVPYSRLLLGLSDHCPILCSVNIKAQKLPKTLPNSSGTRRAIGDLLQRHEEENIRTSWRKILRSRKLIGPLLSCDSIEPKQDSI